ncbi:hypothetical protein [Spirosoma utsteinense]|uniref:Uncharacterized protein n=1 Tax=Spirosoma utsteinense TaxID=2585773 RepID=A0ABR6W1Y4_9BACT|nr:hypothetical protein [Spirosoma utsteinense]MBC3784950.1 hypothetical protein [Spirosoma utsteinense]MBC3790442.1 hypothetical protein [Spirosoma utsteinense]
MSTTPMHQLAKLSLACSIARHFELHGYCAKRIVVDGSRCLVPHEFIPKQENSWFHAVLAIVEGKTVLVEVDCRKPTDAQKETNAALIKSGITVCVSFSLNGFKRWFEAYVLTIPKSTSPISPYNQRHPIAHLATPDL